METLKQYQPPPWNNKQSAWMLVPPNAQLCVGCFLQEIRCLFLSHRCFTDCFCKDTTYENPIEALLKLSGQRYRPNHPNILWVIGIIKYWVKINNWRHHFTGSSELVFCSSMDEWLKGLIFIMQIDQTVFN